MIAYNSFRCQGRLQACTWAEIVPTKGIGEGTIGDKMRREGEGEEKKNEGGREGGWERLCPQGRG
jgi:hypothetical protein